MVRIPMNILKKRPIHKYLSARSEHAAQFAGCFPGPESMFKHRYAHDVIELLIFEWQILGHTYNIRADRRIYLGIYEVT